jgi:hypothetical protein
MGQGKLYLHSPTPKVAHNLYDKAKLMVFGVVSVAKVQHYALTVWIPIGTKLSICKLNAIIEPSRTTSYSTSSSLGDSSTKFVGKVRGWRQDFSAMAEEQKPFHASMVNAARTITGETDLLSSKNRGHIAVPTATHRGVHTLFCLAPNKESLSSV